MIFADEKAPQAEQFFRNREEVGRRAGNRGGGGGRGGEEGAGGQG